MQTFLVASPGRTGSTFLTNYVTNLTQSLNINSVVIQTHDPTNQMSKDTVVIKCQRRDLWAHTLSSAIAQARNEWTEYSECAENFTINLEDFENKYVWNLRWFEAFDHYTSYDKVITLFFEDFMRNPGIINQALGLPDTAITTTTKPSPNLKDRVDNLDELKTLFAQLENNQYLHTFPINERGWAFTI